MVSTFIINLFTPAITVWPKSNDSATARAFQGAVQIIYLVRIQLNNNVKTVNF